MTPPPEEPAYCSDLSQQAGELLYGTATQTQAFLLLEYNGVWGEKALDESNLPGPVKVRLNELGKSIRGLKTLLIKTQRQPRSGSGLRLFVAALSSLTPRLYAFELVEYADLLTLDVPAILIGEPAYDAYRWEEPLYLVCANGRRDLCCARYGMPVYNALSGATQFSGEPQVWQCTHVGGHRFAANLICLPHAVLYGRVHPENALAILDTDCKGQIYLNNLRGRVAFPPLAQAAEYYLRREHEEFSIDAYRLLDVQEITAGEWVVRFETHPVGEILTVQTRVGWTEGSVFESCTLDKRTAMVHYDFQMVER